MRETRIGVCFFPEPGESLLYIPTLSTSWRQEIFHTAPSALCFWSKAWANVFQSRATSYLLFISSCTICDSREEGRQRCSCVAERSWRGCAGSRRSQARGEQCPWAQQCCPRSLGQDHHHSVFLAVDRRTDTWYLQGCQLNIFFSSNSWKFLPSRRIKAGPYLSLKCV